jgi:hypothetical protein
VAGALGDRECVVGDAAAVGSLNVWWAVTVPYRVPDRQHSHRMAAMTNAGPDPSAHCTGTPVADEGSERLRRHGRKIGFLRLGKLAKFFLIVPAE